MTRWHLQALSALAILAAVSAGQALGQNMDPAGPPGSAETTMKTLDQIEPRTYIAELPFAITNPGSYYLTRSLTGQEGSNGINIASDDVRLDLNGFAVIGAGSNSWHGIYVEDKTPPYRNISICNGVVSDWGFTGLGGNSAMNGRVTGVTAFNNGYWHYYPGIGLGANWVVTDCEAYTNHGAGIAVGTGAAIVNCKARDNVGNGIGGGQASRIVGCSSLYNGNYGFYVDSYCTIRDCIAFANGSNGVWATTYCTIENNLCGYNYNAPGITVGNGCRVANNHLVINSVGVAIQMGGDGNLVVGNSAYGNGAGFDVQNGVHYGEVLSPGSLGAGFTNSNPWANFDL